MQLARCTFVPQTHLALRSVVGRGGGIKRSGVGLIILTRMAEKLQNRSRWLKVRLNPAEQEGLEKSYRKSSFHTLSAYARALLLGHPVTVIHRDASSDALLEELARVRRELNAAGINLNQAMRRINSAHDIPDKQLWMSLLTVIRSTLEPAIAQMSKQINQYAEVLSQKSRPGKA